MHNEIGSPGNFQYVPLDINISFYCFITTGTVQNINVKTSLPIYMIDNTVDKLKSNILKSSIK